MYVCMYVCMGDAGLMRGDSIVRFRAWENIAPGMENLSGKEHGNLSGSWFCIMQLENLGRAETISTCTPRHDCFACKCKSQEEGSITIGAAAVLPCLILVPTPLRLIPQHTSHTADQCLRCLPAKNNE